MVAKQKKKVTDKTVSIIGCAVLYGVLALFVAGLFVFSANCARIYHSPKVADGKVDFADTDIPSRDVACNLAGKWEFFYNQWIVTDGGDAQPDGMLSLPDVWTYKDFGNGALPPSGYASYRLVAENVQPDINVIVYRHYSHLAYRVFVNGQLNYRSGTVSKNADETVVTGRTDEQHPYHTNGEPLEIVIEVSAMKSGGFNAAPWLAATVTGNAYGSGLRSFNYIMFGIATAAVVIGILTYAFFGYKRDITVPLLMLALFAHFLCSKDMMYVLGWRITPAMILSLLTAVASFVLLVVHCWRNGAVLKKIPLIVTAVLAVVSVGLLLGFYGTPLAPVFAFLLIGAGCAYLVPIMLNGKQALPWRAVYGTLFVFLMSVFCFELCDGLGLLVFGTEFIFTFELALIMACLTALWLWKIANAARTAVRVSELECELVSIQNRALKAQIKPHFVYNSLTAIQARYRDGLEEGDKAIEQFAGYLRLVTDSDDEDRVTFEDEVRNVLNYFELENLRAGGKLNLLLDLNYTDFCVPVLSLQPLVENAIRHGGLREKLDGYIQLSSVRLEQYAVVTVRDNGKGFDPQTVCTGVGLANTRKRWELVGATMQIDSAPQAGTRITIQIPLE